MKILFAVPPDKNYIGLSDYTCIRQQVTHEPIMLLWSRWNIRGFMIRIIKWTLAGGYFSIAGKQRTINIFN